MHSDALSRLPRPIGQSASRGALDDRAGARDAQSWLSAVIVVLFVGISAWYIGLAQAPPPVASASANAGAGSLMTAVDIQQRAIDDRAAGDYEGALEQYQKLAHLSHGRNAAAFYGAAACEARLGRTQDSLDHLKQALALDPRFAVDAQIDHEFATLRGSHDFRLAIALPAAVAAAKRR